MMKPFLKMMLAAVFGLLAMKPAAAQFQAQKFAYVDTEYILKNIPEYTDAQEELNTLSQK